MPKQCDQLIRKTIREILLVGVAREVVEREDRDGGASLETGDGQRVEVGSRGFRHL
jgi:hypothetical protein